MPAQRHVFTSESVTEGHPDRSEEHTSELQSQSNLVCRLLLEKKKKTVLSLADGAECQKYVGAKSKAIRAMSSSDGKAAPYVSANFPCRAPATMHMILSQLLS